SRGHGTHRHACSWCNRLGIRHTVALVAPQRPGDGAWRADERPSGPRPARAAAVVASAADLDRPSTPLGLPARPCAGHRRRGAAVVRRPVLARARLRALLLLGTSHRALSLVVCARTRRLVLHPRAAPRTAAGVAVARAVWTLSRIGRGKR